MPSRNSRPSRASAPHRPHPHRGTGEGGWLRSLALWRGAAAAGALATVMAVLVGVNLSEQLRNAPAVQYVAVLSDDQSAPTCW